ncbi:MAG TPA: barstar family protein [Micromonosporaceae bacterium]|nr:barstar family protein [Micromonosporaceae bacterium]
MPLRWLLLDEYSGGPGDADRVVAVSAAVEGLFVDRPPPEYERYTLLGCRAAGRLAEAIESDGSRTWLGNLMLDSRHDPDRPLPAGCDCATSRCACMEELLDITVLSWHPSAHGHGLVDVEMEGLVRGEPRYSNRTLAERPDAIGFELTSDEGEDFGECVDIAGLFRERPQPPMVPAVLVGCLPGPPLQAVLAALAEDGSPMRRRVSASLWAIDADGRAVGVPSPGIFGAVTAVRPSAKGVGLVDVTLDCPVSEPKMPGAEKIWDLWYAGRPSKRNLWADYDRAMRHEWLGAALAHHGGTPDRPAGTEYHLDGQFVTDLDGFYCAMGEAINGPGGYFGWNLDGLDECLLGRWGAMPPFRLVWHNSNIAKHHLVPGYDRHRWSAAVTLDYLLNMMEESGVDVELR